MVYIPPGVIEHSIKPGVGVVTGLTRGGEVRGRVIRIGRTVVIRLVARVAIRIGDVVVAVDVAIRAGPWRHSVLAGQCPASLRVIELAVCPRHRVMAYLASCRELGSNVVNR